MPEIPRLSAGWSTLAAALRAALAAAGDPRDLVEVLGASALAFRIVVGREIALGGWHATAWLHELPEAIARLGWDAEIVYAGPDDPRRERLRRRASELAQRSLLAGRPALCFGVHLPEWGLLTGWDPAGREFAVSGVLDGRGGAASLPEARLGEGDVPLLCVVALTERLPPAADTPARALAAATSHLRGGTPVDRAHDAGLAAWATLAEALASGRVDPPGLAHTIQLLAEARTAVPPYLARARPALGEAARPALAQAEHAFARVAETLAELAARLPFPPSATLGSRELGSLAGRVEDAARAELDGLRALEAALTAAERAPLSRISLRDLTPADGAHLFACLRDLPIAGLEPAASACRERVAPGLGQELRAKLLVDPAGQVVGHVYATPLGQARAPLACDGDPARVLVLHCPWIDRRLRGQGLGRRLMDALAADARAAGFTGIASIATGEEQFLPDAPLKHLGYREVDRRELDDARLLWLGFGNAPEPRFAAAPARTPGSPLVVIRHAYHCPLLLAARREVAAAAASQGAELDEADAAPAGGPAGERAQVAGNNLPFGYVPRETVLAWMREARHA